MIVDHIRRMNALFYGLERSDLAKLAFDFAERNKIKQNFWNETASEQWLQNFTRRHSQISLRRAEFTSIARARVFNRL